jgi:hypothetical protein
MMDTRSMIEKVAVAAALLIFALGTVACGPDCDGLCNDGADLCQRIDDCYSPPDLPSIVDQLCEEYDSAAECSSDCDRNWSDEEKETAEKGLDEVREALGTAACELDCDGLCNDFIEICARFDACEVDLEDPPGCEGIDSLAECVGECHSLTGDELEAAGAAFKQLKGALDEAGC